LRATWIDTSIGRSWVYYTKERNVTRILVLNGGWDERKSELWFQMRGRRRRVRWESLVVVVVGILAASLGSFK
jgi:hypothetical protein